MPSVRIAVFISPEAYEFVKNFINVKSRRESKNCRVLKVNSKYCDEAHSEYVLGGLCGALLSRMFSCSIMRKQVYNAQPFRATCGRERFCKYMSCLLSLFNLSALAFL